ncbi:MAG: DUF433 domain-containing protein [Oscillatoriales cyanobacterium RU_3_3]|nr:DUF433 domain-containing protein [Oscillatoriales cyanobacterium RU_3_3]NJR21129.1 DUF433 domain-containing protein [Richelia sp. CSU_2_1]NJR76187.1 DUF433 domain-containing protein [Scytonema sp. CRU_2_7]
MPASVAYLFDRITVNPRQCGGRPCIRGMRIRVIDILELLAAGEQIFEFLEELPDLELEDIKATLLYAVRKLDRPVLAA